MSSSSCVTPNNTACSCNAVIYSAWRCIVNKSYVFINLHAPQLILVLVAVTLLFTLHDVVLVVINKSHVLIIEGGSPCFLRTEIISLKFQISARLGVNLIPDVMYSPLVLLKLYLESGSCYCYIDFILKLQEAVLFAGKHIFQFENNPFSVTISVSFETSVHVCIRGDLESYGSRQIKLVIYFGL